MYMYTSQGRRKLFFGGEVGEWLSKNVGHRSWLMRKSLQLYLKRDSNTGVFL